jgi:hypothetical protein
MEFFDAETLALLASLEEGLEADLDFDADEDLEEV